MTTDKTLADAKPGGCVQLGDGLPPLPPEVDAVHCMIRGEEDLAEACDYYYTAEQMRDYARAALSERIGQNGTLTDAARAAIPFVAYAFSEGVDGAEEAGRAIEAALSAQPSPGGQDARELLAAEFDKNEVTAAAARRLRNHNETAVEAAALRVIAARQPVGEPVAVTQFRYPECSDWYDVTDANQHVLTDPDYEKRTLYAAPPAQAVDDRFPNGLSDAIEYANDMEEAASALYEKVFGHEDDGEDCGTVVMRRVLHHLTEQPAQAVDLVGLRALSDAWLEKAEKVEKAEAIPTPRSAALWACAKELRDWLDSQEVGK